MQDAPSNLPIKIEIEGEYGISHEPPCAKTWWLCTVIRRTGLDHFDLPSRVLEEDRQT